MTLNFRQAGDVIYLVGQSRNDINCSAYLYHVLGEQYSPAPHFDMEEEYALQKMIAILIKSQLMQSVHDVSDGGLFTTLLESAMVNDLGFRINTGSAFRKDAFLFGEAQSRVVISVSPVNCTEVETLMAGMAFEMLGEVSKGDVVIDDENWGNIQNWKTAYDTVLEDLMEEKEGDME